MDDQLVLLGLSLLILTITIIIGLIFNRLYSKIIIRSTGEMNNDPTNYKFLKHLILGMIYLVGISLSIYVVPSLRTVAGSMLAGAGILAVSVGFASQHALSNIISGFFIVVFKPFKVNDRLRVQSYQGTVEDITLRHTIIRDFENKRIVIPNTVISDEVIVNSDFAEQQICKWIDIVISHDSNMQLAKTIMEEEVLKHPNHIDPRTPKSIAAGEPEAPVRVLNLKESGVTLRAWAWSREAAEAFRMSCDLYESIKIRFDEEGIKMGHLYLDVQDK